MKTKNNLTVKVTISLDYIVILADDGYNPFCIPLTLEDAEQLNKELNIVIERKKNEQQKDLCITSEQLTEQWKKGELPDGVYYCNTGNTIETLFTWGKNYHQLTNNKDEVYIPEMDDCEILAPVPSCEEWQAKLEENDKLKKLLKECRPYIGYDTYEFDEKVSKLLTKIDEVLK